MDRTPNSWGYTPHGSDVYFCSQACKLEWLTHNMDNIEQGRRLSLSDTDERAKVMPRLRTIIIGV